MPEQTQTSFKQFSESLRLKKLSPVNLSSITGKRSIRLSGNIIAKKEVGELGSIRKILGGLLGIEKKYYKFLGDRILYFSKEEERKKFKEEEKQQEEKKQKGKDKVKDKNPILEKAKSDLSMIGQFFKNLTKFFVGYKILEWAGKPENTKKLQDFAELFIKIFKFISSVTEFGVNVVMKTLEITSKVINGVFDFIGKIAEFFTFKWLGDGLESLLKTIENITSIFASIPNAISLTLNFLTNLLPNFLESVLTDGIFGSKKDLQSESDKSLDVKKSAETPESPAPSSTTGTDTGSKQSDLGEKAKSSLANIGSNILKTLFPGADIAASIGGKVFGSVKSLFGGEKTKETLPKLAKGGIVTKPTQAIVGEAGPEAILPLDKLGSFGVDGFKSATNKVIPKFMKLLTLPFQIIGAGILALISNTISKIPGVGQFILPLLSNIGNSFGLPPGLVKGMSNFVGGIASTVSSGLGNISEIFGMSDPKISSKPSGDTSVRGLLGDILGTLIEKNKGNTTTQTTADSGGGSSTPDSSGSTPADSGSKIGGSTKPLPQNASLAKAGDTKVQNLAGTVEDLRSKGYNYVTGTNNRFFQDEQGRLYEAKTTRNNTSLASMMGVGKDVYSLRAVTQDQIDKGFTHAGDERTVGNKNQQEIQRQLELFRIINKGGTLQKETTGTQTQVKENDTWKHKAPGGPIQGSGIGDKVKILAEPQEYMLNKHAAAALGGPKVLDKINFGLYPRFGNGVMTAQTGGNILRYMTGGTIIEYITGDRKHPAYRSDHGGGAYHDHLAFKSKAERDKAIDYLQKKGWYIGSKNDGSHASGSYHYTNQAFDVPFYPNQSRKGVTDDATGESKLSSALRNDLKNAGFAFGGPDVKENDTIPTSPGSQEPVVDWSAISKGLGELYQTLNAPPNIPETSSSSEKPKQSPAPKITGSIPSSSTTLQHAQRENSRLQSQSRNKPQSGNIINIGEPNKTISEVTTQPLTPALGGTTPPNALINYPVAP